MAPRRQQNDVLPVACGTESDDAEELSIPGRRQTLRGVLVAAGLLAVGLFAGAVTSLGRDRAPQAATGAGYDGIVRLDGEKGEEKSGHGKKEKADKKDKGEDKSKKPKTEDDCSWGKQNCNETKCCNNPGRRCYEQTKWYAQCKDSCVEGAPDPFHWDELAWSCKSLGERAEGGTSCSGIGEDCRKTGCCQQVGTQCFKKNDDWATCKSTCIAGAPDLADANGDPWNCSKLGPWTQGAAPWVAQKCPKAGQDCRKAKCCAEEGKQCFEQTEGWAECKYDCQHENPDRPWEPKWSCKELGVRTPSNQGMPPQLVGKWVPDQCADLGQDCRKSRCCLNVNTRCYEKNKDWAMCMDKCTRGKHADDNNETWSCQPLGPRTVHGIAIKGTPAIFCWVLFQTSTYENDIVKRQLETHTGIVECDDFALLSTDPETVMTMGKAPDTKEVKTLNVEMAEITRSVDGTAGNAKLFINCWNAILKDGRWRRNAWIIKVDPDAVIIAQRVRDHMAMHVLENVYVVNCNKFPDSPNFPMMYGSVEIYSFKAIDTYARNLGLCMTDMGMMLPQWGEDYFMTHCLDHIGVGRISDFASVGDNVCTGGDCADKYFSAFHPKKTVDEWQQCWDAAHGKATPAPSWR